MSTSTFRYEEIHHTSSGDFTLSYRTTCTTIWAHPLPNPRSLNFWPRMIPTDQALGCQEPPSRTDCPKWKVRATSTSSRAASLSLWWETNTSVLLLINLDDNHYQTYQKSLISWSFAFVLATSKMLWRPWLTYILEKIDSTLLFLDNDLSVSSFASILASAMMRKVNPFYEGVTYQATLPHWTGLPPGMISCGVNWDHFVWFQSSWPVLIVLVSTRWGPVGDAWLNRLFWAIIQNLTAFDTVD